MISVCKISDCEGIEVNINSRGYCRFEVLELRNFFGGCIEKEKVLFI